MNMKTSGLKLLIVLIIIFFLSILAVFINSFYKNRNIKENEINVQLSNIQNSTNDDSLKEERDVEKGENNKDYKLFIEGEILEAELLKNEDEINIIIGKQQDIIDELNKQNAGLSQIEQCSRLLHQTPGENSTWFSHEYTEFYMQNIVEYWEDLEDREDLAKEKQDKDLIKAVDNAKLIATPYYENFIATCSNLYDYENGVLNYN